MSGARILLAISLALGLASQAACSAVEHQYTMRGYDSQAPAAIKRIVLTTWGPQQHPALATALREIAADYIKLRKSYLLYDTDFRGTGWAAACLQHEGVLHIRATEVTETDSEMSLTVIATLYRCSDGAILWRVEGAKDSNLSDSDLESMSHVYAQKIGPHAARYAAPVFVLLQDLLTEIPDVQLSDEEVIEKIELE